MEAATFSSKKKPPPAPPSSIAKTALSGGGGGVGYFATSYDDVFGGPPKFPASSTLAPRAEDYSEIFSGFRTSSSSSRAASSSIPVLDLPAVDGCEFDSVFDYDLVFGGLNTVDFAVPFEELFRSSDGFDASDDDDAWTPVGTGSLSDDSDPFAFSEKSQCSLNGNSDQSLEGKQFNVSYHKVNPGTSTCIPNTIHVAQLNDFPGYTCVVEEATSLREMDKETFCSQAVEDNVHNMETPIIAQKHVKINLAYLSHEGAGSKSFDDDLRSGGAHSVSMSHVNSTFASTSDINLPTKSSHFAPPLKDLRPSPVPSERNRVINGLSSGPKASENCGFEATIDGSLPPFFDMEVDASSSAAASAAAMKDVMEKAQAKLKAAREFRGRKDTFQNGGEVGSETDVNGGEAEMAQTDSEIKRSRATSDRGASKMKSTSKARHGRNISQILPDTLADEQPIGVNGQPIQANCSLPMDTAFTDVGGEWKEARQYFEFVNNDSSRLAYQPPSNGDGKNETFKQHDNYDNDSDSAGESRVTQTNRRRLKATRIVSRQGYYEKMIKVAQEVHDTVTSGHAETKDGLQDMFHRDCQKQKPKLAVEPQKNEGRVWDTNRAEAKYAEVIVMAEAEMKPKNVVEDETMKTRETAASYRDQNGRNRNNPLLNMTKEAAYNREGERQVKGTCEREESGKGAHEVIVELSTDALKQRKNKASMEVKDTRSKVASGDVFGGERLQRTFVSKENERIEDVQKMKAEFWRPTDAFEDGVAKERLERTCNGVENYKTTELQQKYEHEEHLKKTAHGQGPEMMLDQDVELEKCWEYLETVEQEKSRNLDKGHQLVDENNSVGSQKNGEKEEKHEQTAEKRNVQSKFKQEGVELRDSVNINEKTNFKEEQNDAFRSHMETEGEGEDLEPDSSSDIELSINDKHQKVSNAVYPNGKDVELGAVPCRLKSPHSTSNGSLEVSSGKENGEIGTTLLDDSKLKCFETADVQFDAKELRCAVPRVGLNDKELEGEADSASLKIPQMKADCYVELSTGKENGDIGTVLSEETRLKAVEATNVIDERQTVFPKAHDCPIAVEHIRRPVHASHTLQMNEKYAKSGEDFAEHDQILMKENKKIADPVSDPKLVIRNQGVGQVLCGKEENNRPAQSERMNGWNELASNRVGAHSIMPDWKQRVQRTSQVSSLSQNNERVGKFFNHNGSLEEKDEDKKIDLEKEHLRKLEEEREREREREKDKMAVEIAIQEARERAYADARDRAERAALERATEEVRQRAMAEARERLEKACAEARERSFTNKASEARLRAERAAVERATAEARQRAIEKSMADRAILETRERVQRSVSEKYNTSERDVIMRQSSFPSTSERFDTGNGEPAQRCKARLERHRRTVERVAKALEEKNMRDLQAQREQVERNRFAETLDADIKRWSSGKAGNLRALLSTLQYILGPDSGWQPIPLTEVITAAAVKKAYRKATLCVHPDKLQQRGASIQQKYISEKVFDLLKEAWNRFNSEEK